MKFAGKVTLSALAVMIFAVSISSFTLVTLSFRDAMAREIHVAEEELQMLRFSYESLCGVRGITVENLPVTGAGLRRALDESDYFSGHRFRVVGPDGIVYATVRDGSSGLLDVVDGDTSAYVVRRDSGTGQTLIHCAGPVELPDGFLYMEMTRDITGVYRTRETQYMLYRWLLLAVVLLGGGLLYVLSTLLTRPIKSLERGAKRLGQGDYGARVEVQGDDELALLAGTFNHMADTVEDNIQSLEDAAQRQESFTASFVHELKTPLTSIIGYADLLRSQSMPEELRFKAASYIFSEGKRLENLSRALMSLHVLGNTEENMVDIRTAQLAEAVQRAVQPSLGEKQLTLTVDVEESVVRGEPHLLETLLVNLLDNGRKASFAGGTLSLRGEVIPAGYRFTVEDHGRGIPQEDLTHLTEAFYMVDKSRSRAEGGAGLGLALCQRIAELHGGILRFESEEGVGTTVELILGGESCG